jgi:prevent-host-death family protein
MLETVEIHDAQPRLRELVLQVNKGVEVLLTDGSTPLARLVPVREASPKPSPEPRIAGLHAGAIWTSEDFDDPLVTQAQKPAMRLVPILGDASERIAGLHLGMGWMSDDFDAPLPDEFWVGEE